MTQDKLARYFDSLEEINQRFLRILHYEMREQGLGITGNQVFVLKKIYDRGKMTVSQVAEDLGVSLSAVTAIVDRLCKIDYLTRRRDEDDRRVVWLELTPKGRETVEICDECRRAALRKYMSKLDEEDIDKLLEINEKLLKILQEEE